MTEGHVQCLDSVALKQVPVKKNRQKNGQVYISSGGALMMNICTILGQRCLLHCFALYRPKL